ncbi:MAG: porin [Gammaproteobacteria bacterium]|nr:porin [Gammaproteobacteria bacterium]
MSKNYLKTIFSPNINVKRVISNIALVTAAALMCVNTASADETKPPEPRFKIYGWLEGGFTTNADSPNDDRNFGHLFTDRSNQPLLNQAVITGERLLVPQPGEFDWGMKFQFMYGSDARFIHSLGLLSNTTDDRAQPDIVEAYLNLHFPIFTEGGLDVRAGKFVTLEGAETIDPRTNVFYSHTYIFNFGIPFNHSGALATLHATPWLDVFAGITRGVNTSLADNNGSAAFHGGFGLTLLGGKVVSFASTHIGAENPRDNHNTRYLSDITTTWKISDTFTSITDLNYIYEESVDARGYGIAQYFTYAYSDWLIPAIRFEVWRDEKGFFVAQFGANNDFIRIERGDLFTPSPRTVGGGNTTYGAITAGVTIKPATPQRLNGLLAGIMVRPELRYDRSLNDTRPFNDSGTKDQFTASFDVILQF